MLEIDRWLFSKFEQSILRKERCHFACLMTVSGALFGLNHMYIGCDKKESSFPVFSLERPYHLSLSVHIERVISRGKRDSPVSALSRFVTDCLSLV